MVEEGPECQAPLRAVEEVRKVSEALPVLVMSAERIESPLMQMDSTAQLAKPVRRSRLYNVLSAMVAGNRQAALSGGPDDANGDQPSSGGSGVRLLLAEDDKVNQAVAVAMLEKCGYEVDIAENGRLAPDMLQRERYGAVLMDCQMPEVDGYEATHEIRRTEDPGRRIPIIAMTAHSMTADRDRCLAAGMDDYISKPVSLDRLSTILARWVPAPGEPVSSEV